MKKGYRNGNVLGILFVGTMVCCMAWNVAPAHAQIRVVVVPLTESASGPPAPLPKTGQTASSTDYDDGYYEKGVAAPTPRFTDNGNGTVTDHLTGLIWLKKGNCTEFYSGDPNAGGDGSRPWDAAVTSAHMLQSGYCELNDGSAAGAWRLPNVKELKSLIDFGQFTSPLLPPDCPLEATTVPSNYWSATTSAGGPGHAWHVSFMLGYDNFYSKSTIDYVRAVRGGQ